MDNSNTYVNIDLTKDNILDQIEEASKKLNKKPWYKRIIGWLELNIPLRGRLNPRTFSCGV